MFQDEIAWTVGAGLDPFEEPPQLHPEILGTNEAFAFIGTAAFSHTAGELRYEEVSGFTYVYGDTNGDGIADFMIRLDGLHALSSGDFVL